MDKQNVVYWKYETPPLSLKGGGLEFGLLLDT